MKKKVIASLFTMFIGGIAVFAQDPMVDKKNTDSKPPYIYPEESIVRENIEKWQDMKFGMFIHWGTYSQWGIVESWSICPEAYKFCMVWPEGMNYFDYVRKYEVL